MRDRFTSRTRDVTFGDLAREIAEGRIIFTKPEQKEIWVSKCLKFAKFPTLHAFMISIIAMEDEYLFLQDLIILVVLRVCPLNDPLKRTLEYRSFYEL